MKIGTSDLKVTVPQTTTPSTPKASEEAAATATKTASSAGVSVSVSNLARSLETPEATSTSEVDTAKVNQVKASIQNGTFVVNPEAIADKLLSNAQEMLNRTTK
jgi:negative regulator of flagellin synthesis FlgM